MKAVLFDLDGTLVETESLKAAALSAAVGHFGGSVSPETYKNVMGESWETDCRDFETALPLLSKAQKEWIHTTLTRHTPEIPWLKRF